MCLLPITILYAWVMLVLNLPFKALMFLTLMRPSLVLFLVLWLKLVKDFLKVRCRLALLPFLISCLIWLDLVASLPLIKERILVIILLLLVLFLVLWLKLVKDFLKVRCRLALLPFLISCLIWLDLVASLPLIKERILVIILLLHFLSLMLGSVLVLMLPLLV